MKHIKIFLISILVLVLLIGLSYAVGVITALALALLGMLADNFGALNISKLVIYMFIFGIIYAFIYYELQ